MPKEAIVQPANQALSSSTSTHDPFEVGGYLACQCVAICFALALHHWVSAPTLTPDASLTTAILAAAAAVIGTVAVIFEVRLLAMRRHWFQSPLLALAIGFLAGLALLWAVPKHVDIAYVTFGVAVIRLLMMAVSAGPRAALVPMLAGVAIGYWAFLLSFADGYKTLWIEQAILSGTVHVDLLFHAAIANMLSGYGVGSLGVDGLATFPYHFGSHRLMMVLYGLLGMGPLPFYSVVFPLIFGPLFVCVMFLFAVAFKGFLARVEGSGSSPGSTPAWYWAVASICFIGVIAAPTRRELGVWENAFHSESFGVALLVAYLGGIWLFDQLGEQMRIRITWRTGVLLALYLWVLCLLKISVGLVIGAVFGYVVLRSRETIFRKLLGCVAIALPLGYGLWLTRANTNGGQADTSLLDSIKPFAFLRDSVGPDFYVFSFLAFFGPVIIFVLYRLLLPRQKQAPVLRLRLKSHTLLDVELAIVITVTSVLPGIVLAVPQGSTNFFAEVSYWWMQPLMAVVVSRVLMRFTAASQTPDEDSQRNRSEIV